MSNHKFKKKKKKTGYNINIYKNFWCKFFK